MDTNNSTFKSKLRNYSILAGSALASASIADGQIIYHNINPDTILSGNENYYFDLNGGARDFAFFEQKVVTGTHSGGDLASYKAFILPGSYVGNSYNAIAGTIGNKQFYPNVYNSGQKIGSHVNWFNRHRLVTNSISVEGVMGYEHVKYPGGTYVDGGGKWRGQRDKFVALKIDVRSVNNTDSLTYYGWARCTLSNDAKTLTISDYAYQSISDSSILAGDKGSPTGISSQPLQNVRVYSSGKDVHVTYVNAPRDGMTIIIRDMLGKEVQAIQTNSEVNIYNLENLADGIYTVTVKSKGAEMTRKVSIR